MRNIAVTATRSKSRTTTVDVTTQADTLISDTRGTHDVDIVGWHKICVKVAVAIGAQAALGPGRAAGQSCR